MKYSHLILATACIVSNASLVPATPIRLQDAPRTPCATTPCSPAPQTPSHHLDPSALPNGKSTGPALSTRSLHARSLQFDSGIQILDARSFSGGRGRNTLRHQQGPQGPSQANLAQVDPRLRPVRLDIQDLGEQQPNSGPRFRGSLSIPYRCLQMVRNRRRDRSPFTRSTTPEPKSPHLEPESTFPTRFNNSPVQLCPHPPAERDPLPMVDRHLPHIMENRGINLDRFQGSPEEVIVLSQLPGVCVRHTVPFLNDQFFLHGRWHDLPPGGFPEEACVGQPNQDDWTLRLRNGYANMRIVGDDLRSLTPESD